MVTVGCPPGLLESWRWRVQIYLTHMCVKWYTWLRDRAVCLKHAPIPRLWRNGFHLFLILLALGNCFAWRQILNGVSVRSEREDREIRFVHQVETQAGGWRIASITQGKHSLAVIPQLIAIFIHTCKDQTLILLGKKRQVFLADFAHSRSQNGIARDYGTLPTFPNATSFLISRAHRKGSVRVSVFDSALPFAARPYQCDRGSPCELRRQVPAILKKHNYFSILFFIFWNDEVSDDPVFPAQGYVGTLSGLKGLTAFYIGRDGLLSRFIGRKRLPQSEPSSKEYAENGDDLDNSAPKKLLIIVGFVFVAFSVMLLYKVWSDINFHFSANMNIATYVALILVSALSFWLGMWLCGIGFNLISFTSFHG
jgi:hypothetical protein